MRQARVTVSTTIALWLMSPYGASYALDPVATLNASDAASGFGEGFGKSVAISGDWIAVGAPVDQRATERGAVYMFRRDGARWVFHQKLRGFHTDWARFGRAVAMDGNRLVIGAPGERRAYLYEPDDQRTPEDLSDDFWDAVAIMHPFPSEFGSFGISVDIKDELIVIAMPSTTLPPLEHQVGRVYVFRHDGIEWLPDGRLRGDDTEADDLFASSVALSAGTVVVGAPFDDDAGEESGSVYVFRRDHGEWTQAAKLFAPNPGSPRAFGASVAGVDKVLVVTPHVFRLHVLDWLYEATLLPSNKSGVLTSGGPVAVSQGAVLIVSYLFRRTNGQWQQSNKLTETPSGFLRSSVSLDGDYAVSGGFHIAFVHRTCDGCGTLREFATVQNCMYADAAQSASCSALDFSGDGKIDLADYSDFLILLVGP
ncbi:MAG: FG-GAP repeat protein [Planctomycetes bacterium]|nr:FG-GAP repeat protein [Planctomycetota bacterium]